MDIGNLKQESEMPAVEIVTRLKIRGDRFFYSTGPLELFEKIDKFQSIKKATEAMGMSYTKALRIIRVAEEELGFELVATEKGGNKHGQTVLTEKGKQVMNTYRDIYTDVSSYAERLFKEKFVF